MGMYNLAELTKKLINSEFSLLDSKTLKALLEIKDERNYYRIVKTLLKSNIIIRIERDAYQVAGKTLNHFEVGNFLYQPSYISLESALNYWGILPQFPFEVTSVTLKKTASKRFADIVYSYTHLSARYFGLFTKQDGVIIALPEKALFDQVYLAVKGLKTLNFDEYDLARIKKNSMLEVCEQMHAKGRIKNIIKDLFAK